MHTVTHHPHPPAEGADTFPEGWRSAAVRPGAPGWYERRYSDGTYAHHWSGEQWSSTKGGNAHWRQLADAPYPMWRPLPASPTPSSAEGEQPSACIPTPAQLRTLARPAPDCLPGRHCERHARGLGGCIAGECNRPAPAEAGHPLPPAKVQAYADSNGVPPHGVDSVDGGQKP